VNTPWSEVPDLLLPALGETALMVLIVMGVVVALGTPLGILLFNTSQLGLFPRAGVHGVVAAVTNVGRSLPFLVLMAAVIPFTRMVVGTNIGIRAAIVPMALAGIPFFARLVENAIASVPHELMDAGVALGGSPLQVIGKVQFGEALPRLIGGLTINVIAMVEYSAIAGVVGAGGIGYLAVNYGYQRFDAHTMLACVVTLVVLTQVIQLIGDRLTVQLSREAR
jgi:D-methionine transport system permease protein